MGVGKNAVKVELAQRHRLFQGDSLSPLLYCLSNRTPIHGSEVFRVNYGDTVVSHLCFIGNVKMFAKQLSNTLGVVDRVSHVVGMELNLWKCAVAHTKQGKLVEGVDCLLDKEHRIEDVPTGGTLV